jgi:hypothetical protein
MFFAIMVFNHEMNGKGNDMTYSRFGLIVMILATSVALFGFKKAIHRAGDVEKKQHIDRSGKGEKPLDLTLAHCPTIFFNSENTSLSMAEIRGRPSVFHDQNASNTQIELKGRVIMSAEPEAEKRKTADGAGIMINIRH